MNFVHHSTPSGGKLLPRRPAIRSRGPRLESRVEHRSALCRANAERRWRSDYRQGAHTRRTARRKGPRDGTADLGADEMKALDAQRIHEAVEVVAQTVEGPRGIPAAWAWTHQPYIVPERLELVPPICTRFTRYSRMSWPQCRTWW